MNKTLFPSRSLVPIQPKSEAAESCDHRMCAWRPICNSVTVSVQGMHVRCSDKYMKVSVIAFQNF